MSCARGGPGRRSLALVMVPILACFARPLPCLADDATKDEVRAAFVLNFAKYTEWPSPHPEGGTLRICAVESRPLSGELALLDGRRAQGYPVEVRAPTSPGDWPSCHVLLLASTDGAGVASILDTVAGLPVLTVSDRPEFIMEGGMVGLKWRVGRIRFEVNLRAVREAGLELSSHVLRLADKVLQ